MNLHYTVTMKKLMSFILIIILLITIGVCVFKPKMHKQFSFSVIDYIIKFNKDGSATTVKQTTTTRIQKGETK